MYIATHFSDANEMLQCAGEGVYCNKRGDGADLLRPRCCDDSGDDDRMLQQFVTSSDH